MKKRIQKHKRWNVTKFRSDMGRNRSGCLGVDFVTFYRSVQKYGVKMWRGVKEGWAQRFHKRRKISWLVERLSAYQGLCYMESVSALNLSTYEWQSNVSSSCPCCTRTNEWVIMNDRIGKYRPIPFETSPPKCYKTEIDHIRTLF
jgi:hypothetical protein